MTSQNIDLSTPQSTEKAFYTAFVDCSVEAMAAVWAEDGVLCIHPGSAPVSGRPAVLRSWEHIFSGAGRPRLQVTLLSRTERDGLAVHVVEERFDMGSADGSAGTAALVVATNVYRRDDHGWRLLEHHASVPAPPPERTLQ